MKKSQRNRIKNYKRNNEKENHWNKKYDVTGNFHKRKTGWSGTY